MSSCRKNLIHGLWACWESRRCRGSILYLRTSTWNSVRAPGHSQPHHQFIPYPFRWRSYCDRGRPDHKHPGEFLGQWLAFIQCFEQCRVLQWWQRLSHRYQYRGASRNRGKCGRGRRPHHQPVMRRELHHEQHHPCAMEESLGGRFRPLRQRSRSNPAGSQGGGGHYSRSHRGPRLHTGL